MNNFIFRLKNNNTYHFYIEKGSNLLFKKLLSDNSWSKPLSLVNDTTESLNIGADYNDFFHIIYQNKTGSIIYSVFDGENLRVYEMLKSRTNDRYERYFKIVPSSNIIHFFYVLRKDNLYSIIHQHLQNFDFSMPKILVSLPDSKVNFDVSSDSSGNLHLFFESNEVICYKKFTLDTLQWHDYPDINHAGTIINNLSTCITRSYNIFLTYQKLAPDKSVILILKVLKNKNKIFEEYTLGKFQKPFKHIEISPILEDIVLTALENDNYNIYYVEKFKFLWEQPKKIQLGNYKIGQYTSYYPYENFYIKLTPFNCLNGLSLPILNKLNIDVIHKKMLEEEISALKSRINNLEKAMFERNNEIEKILIKMRYLENRL
jgi:hypothetical protein